MFPISPIDVQLLSAAILLVLDAIIVGIRAELEGKFSDTDLIFALLQNTAFAALFALLDLLYVAEIAFGLHILQNLIVLRLPLSNFFRQL